MNEKNIDENKMKLFNLLKKSYYYNENWDEYYIFENSDLDFTKDHTYIVCNHCYIKEYSIYILYNGDIYLFCSTNYKIKNDFTCDFYLIKVSEEDDEIIFNEYDERSGIELPLILLPIKEKFNNIIKSFKKERLKLIF